MERFKEFEKSAVLLERAVALKPDDLGLRKQLFGLLVAQGRLNDALTQIHGDTNYPEIRKLLIDAYLRAGDFAKAEAQARALVTAEPTDRNAIRLLADILSWDGKYTESLKLFHDLAMNDPRDPELPVRIAEVTLWSGDQVAATGLFESLLAKRFDQPTLWEGYVDAASG